MPEEIHKLVAEVLARKDLHASESLYEKVLIESNGTQLILPEDADQRRALIGEYITKHLHAFKVVLLRDGTREILDGENCPSLAKSMRVYVTPTGITIAAGTHIGPKRSTNADRVIVHTGADFAAAIDGIGSSMNGGVRAAQLLAEAEQENPIIQRKTVNEASLAMAGKNMPSGEGACHASARIAIDHKGRRWLIPNHTGDSRILVARNKSEIFSTRDETVTKALIEQGILDPKLEKTHKLRNMITSHISSGYTKVTTDKPIELQSGDTVCIGTDCIFNCLTNKEIASIIGDLPVSEAFHKLAEAMEKSATPSNDNRSLVLMRIP
ncbi:MAG: hypothetical protein RIQ56_254 [Candidatus Parcubacteria bacterium]|jgi:serine/threonine protein phosphatase PrpC